MRSPARVIASLIAVALVCVVAGTSAEAQFSDTQKACANGIGKAGRKFVKDRFKAIAKCKNADLKASGSCDTAKRDDALGKAETKLNDGIDKSCSFSGTVVSERANLKNMQFPGQCVDATPLTEFDKADLKVCMRDSHIAIVDELLGVEYDATVTGPLASADLKCQQEIAKSGQKLTDCVLSKVQKCRKGIMDGKITGVPAEVCQSNDDKTESAIDSCKTKTRDAILKKCTTAQVDALKVCEPDQDNADDGAECIVNTHVRRADSLASNAPPDLIDYEYADPGICGDNVINTLDEECDGSSDAACPGQCGTALVPDGFFACLCKTPPAGAEWQYRERIVEHANADLDNGWSGKSHDSGVVEGGGYIAELYDCDGNGDCIVGPNCSVAPHPPCGTTGGGGNVHEDADAICAALGKGTCRKERTAIGPHCYKNIKQECDPKLPADPICSAPGDYCVKSLHGPPLPIAAGGVPVCIVIVFSEDATGTTNINAGSSAVRYREDSVTHSGISLDKPCPVCGGFCAASRERCAVDADCGSEGPCVTAALCSDGPNQDQPCRIAAPFGGVTDFFGSTSVDCPPVTAQDISAGGLDLLINPITTGPVSRLPAHACDAFGYGANACVGGDSEGRPCTAASECPGGTCLPQCFCPSGNGAFQRPNACDPACVGGDNDGQPCGVDSDCPGAGGFCHLADCRPNPGDTNSIGEGICTTGPSIGVCSVSRFKTCNLDEECQGANCPYCDPGETCVFENQQCFVNSGIIRGGVTGVTDRRTATTFCIPGTTSSSINNVSGLPGPGAITRPISSILVP